MTVHLSSIDVGQRKRSGLYTLWHFFFASTEKKTRTSFFFYKYAIVTNLLVGAIQIIENGKIFPLKFIAMLLFPCSNRIYSMLKFYYF